MRKISGVIRDETAFASLVRNTKKRLCVVYRKIAISDAQELTQDTFLRAFENLSTLRDFDLFAGWLYVIASRVCVSWLGQQKPVMQSLEGMSIKERDTLSYSRYVSEQVGRDAIEALQDRVKKMLRVLPKHERGVVRLYYLSEMRMSEIGASLGVSENTIKSRLLRHVGVTGEKRSMYNPMKLILNKVMIEVNQLKRFQKSTQTCEIQFVSGYTIEVVCGVKTTRSDVGV